MLTLDNFELVMNKSNPHIKLEYRYSAENNTISILMFDTDLYGIIKYTNNNIEEEMIANSITSVLHLINQRYPI